MPLPGKAFSTWVSDQYKAAEVSPLNRLSLGTARIEFNALTYRLKMCEFSVYASLLRASIRGLRLYFPFPAYWNHGVRGRAKLQGKGEDSSLNAVPLPQA